MHVIDGGETGVALAEIYDAAVNPNSEYQRLINISTRGEAGAGENVLIGGFIITGTSPKRVLVRGIGPGLAAFGLTGTLADPRLRVYGATGLGKTHLMQAIGQEVLARKKRAIVRYVTSEQFTNEYVEAIKKQSFSQFRQKYRKVDVLLIDD
eukprot:gene3778-4716_t